MMDVLGKSAIVSSKVHDFLVRVISLHPVPNHHFPETTAQSQLLLTTTRASVANEALDVEEAVSLPPGAGIGIPSGSNQPSIEISQ